MPAPSRSDPPPDPNGTPPVMRAGNPLGSMYFDVRERFVGAVAMLADEQLATSVPACPEWSVQDLLTHLVSMPMAILAAEIPERVMAGDDPNPWLAGLVAEHADRSVTELAHWWASSDDALADLIPNAGLLLADLFTHESDLHGALGSTAHRDAPELTFQIGAALAGLQPGIGDAGLPPISVDAGSEHWSSADGEPGWTLRCGPWEAHRALSSRRTRQELLALPHEGDPTPYLQLMDDHLPLPEQSLGERWPKATSPTDRHRR